MVATLLRVLTSIIFLILVAVFINFVGLHKIFRAIDMVGADPEFVMTEGMVIEVENNNGKLIIEAGPGYLRKFTWEDHQVEYTLSPQTSRTDGSLGIYGSGMRSDTRYIKKTGIVPVLDEGQQHFCNQEEAAEWLEWRGSCMDSIYTPDGLVVGWCVLEGTGGKSLSSLNLDVWQVYINGEKPASLNGATDKIKVYFLEGAGGELVPVADYSPPKPELVNGRQYSGKSIEALNAIGYTYEDVERVIAQGEEKVGDIYTRYRLMEPPRFYLIVVVDENGRVVRLFDD